MTMQMQLPALNFLWISLTLASLFHHGWALGAKCDMNSPTLQQTQVGFGNPPIYMVEVQNNCPLCPVINIHLKCGNFSQSLVNPRLLKVLAYDNCVINGGLPLAPSQKFTFNYSHPKFLMRPTTWFFQCE
ncbi:Protein TAPETUM DETERMINANT 1 like [Quillaja saponaria]|uniref:Protein TAPETUM DETERMINANT 1 like n=1 Tax=Quillaja saponaria TaxID=32244 RepID=A0AAD7LFL6_QUISA|nr:Protein TAPETUM DETERMINANT 1 like [Quillaja saponaria]